MTAARRPAVAVIGTGGTIASVGGDGLELVRYIDRKQMLPIDELLARTPSSPRSRTSRRSRTTCCKATASDPATGSRSQRGSTPWSPSAPASTAS